MKKIFLAIVVLFLGLNYSQAQPTGLQSFDIDINNATLAWDSNQEAFQWEVSYQAALAEPIFISTFDTVVYLSELSPSTRYVWKVRMIDNNGDTSAWSGDNYFYTLSEDTLCPAVADMFFGNMSNNSINIQWLPNEGTNTWTIVCGTPGSNPDNYDILNSTQNHEYTFNQEFIHGTKYQFALRTDCQGVFSQWKYLYAKYLNSQSVFQLPIQIDFSNNQQNQNIGLVSSQNNPWEINNMLRINPNNSSSQSVSYAYIDFVIPEYATSFYVDFSYHTLVNLENAGLKLYILSPGTSFSLNNLPDEESLVGTYQGTNNQWIREHLELPPQYIGSTRRLLFVWYQTGNQNSQTIKIDDIYLTARYCATPDSLEANYINSSSAVLTWDFAENQNIFNLQYREESDTNWITLNSIQPNYLLENLQPSTNYVFRVQADCLTEQSFWSDTLHFSTTTLISSPENLKINTYTHTTAHLSWTDNPEALSYDISVTNTSNNTTSYHSTNLPNIELTQLIPNTIYQINLQAISQAQDTSLSSQIYLHTLCYPEDEYPYLLEDTIEFSSINSFCNYPECWRVETDTIFTPIFNITNLNNPYMEFNYNSSQGVNSQVLVSVDGAVFQNFDYNIINGLNSISLIGFSENTTVRFAIKSELSSTERSYTIKDFTIKDTCLTPENITITHLTHNSAQIEWDNYSNVTNNNLILIQLTDTTTFANVTSPYILNDLTPMTEYKVVLTSTCGNNQALNQTEEYFTTPSPSESCLTPENFICQHYQDKGNETIICTWDAVEDNPYIQWEINYKERFAVNYTSEFITIYPRFTLRNLEMGSQWDFKIRAICSVGDTSSWTPVVQVNVGEQSLEANQYSGKTLKIYPNPADTTLYIQTNATELKEAQLIDSFGRVIRAWDILPRELDISTWEAGTYILKFTMDNQPISRKITVQ